MSGKPTPPFGWIEQRELDYMDRQNLDPANRWLLVVLKVRYDARIGTVTDTISSLVQWSGLSRRSVQRCLAQLADRGLVVRAKHRGAGGPKGHAWSWSTTVLPFDSWPKNTPDVRALTAKSTPNRAEERAKSDGRTRQTTRDNPERPPKNSPERDATPSVPSEDADADGSRTDDGPGISPPGTPQEVEWRNLTPAALGRSWVTYREGEGLTRFTDPKAVSWLEACVPEALAAGCNATDFENALDRWTVVDFADPRNFAKWVIAERDERLHSERDRERSRQFGLQRDREQAELERQRAEPGYQEKIAQILDASRARLGLPPRGPNAELPPH